MRITLSVPGICCCLALRYSWRIKWLFRKTWLGWTSDVVFYVLSLACTVNYGKKNILNCLSIRYNITRHSETDNSFMWHFIYSFSSVRLTRYHVVVQEEWGGGAFLIFYSMLKVFYLKWKAFDLSNKMRYILWVVALLEAWDGRHLLRHIGFYQELEIG